MVTNHIRPTGARQTNGGATKHFSVMINSETLEKIKTFARQPSLIAHKEHPPVKVIQILRVFQKYSQRTGRPYGVAQCVIDNGRMITAVIGSSCATAKETSQFVSYTVPLQTENGTIYLWQLEIETTPETAAATATATAIGQ